MDSPLENLTKQRAFIVTATSWIYGAYYFMFHECLLLTEFSEHLPASYSSSPFYPLAQHVLLIQFLPAGHTGSALAAGRRFCYESSLGTRHPMGERWWGGHERVFFSPFLSGSCPHRPPFPATEISMAVAAVQGHSFGRQTGLRLTASSFHSLAAGKSLKPFEP